MRLFAMGLWSAALCVTAASARADAPSAPPRGVPPSVDRGAAKAETPTEQDDDTASPAAVTDDRAPPPPDPLGPDAELDRWCAPELESLGHDACAHVPAHEAPGPRTLVIFLHGVVKPDTRWQWAQQRGVARAADAHGFVVLMPRGRSGIGPKGMEDWWTWPTAERAQKGVEDELVAEWAAARAELEARGKPFDRVWVFGFSNGAYYATSLAVRAKLGGDAALRADGFAVFAGGSGASYLEKAARAQTKRPPFFVAWGGKDPAHDDQVKLAKMLRGLRWPTKSLGAKKAGHAMTDKQIAEAVRFLGSERPAQASVAPAKKTEARAASTKKGKRR